MAAVTKEINVNVTMGEHQISNTRLDLSFHSNYTECLDMFQNTQLNYEQDIIVQISFPVKSGVDEFTLGENIGYFKNKLNIVREGMKTRYSNVEVVRNYTTYSNVCRLSFGWDSQNSNQNDYQHLTTFVTNVQKAGVHNAELTLEINQRIPTSNYETDEAKLTGKLSGNIKCNETRCNQVIREFINEKPYGSDVPAFYALSLFLNGNVNLRLHHFDDLIDTGVFPWPPEIERVSGFNGLKKVLLPFVGQALSSLPRGEGDMNIYGLVTEVYEKLFNSISGISEIKVGFKNHVVCVKFTGFDFFNGYLPDIDTLKTLGGGGVGTGY